MTVDDPYIGSFTRISERGREIRFVGKSECGMGGPVWGALEVSDLISLPRALPSFILDEKLGLGAIQELVQPSGAFLVAQNNAAAAKGRLVCR